MLDKEEIDRLQELRHDEPHRLLGLHLTQGKEQEIRFFLPGCLEFAFEFKGQIVKAKKSEQVGFFTYKVASDTTALDYRIQFPDGKWYYDPYNFGPTVGELDQYLFARGVHYEIYRILGSHQITYGEERGKADHRSPQGVKGISFAVWAPGALQVFLMGDFNHWKDCVHPMRKLGSSGIWELFLPELLPGVKYKYAIRSSCGKFSYKIDPYANQFELRPNNAGVVTSTDLFCWRDHSWIAARSRNPAMQGPMLIYEMHFGSWKQKEGRWLSYPEIAEELVPYLKEMSYTHIEIMPIMEHPLDESWGYQTTGYFAPTSRYGSVEDFQYFVNYLHMHHIGVLLDWTPGHFPADDFALHLFDGTACYERDDLRMRWHAEWGTCNYNYGKKEVSNFLIGSALFWLEKMHIDGLRVDAVQSMLYLDYGRQGGGWVPNPYGGKEDLDAIEFLKHLNAIVHQRHPGVLMIAEDSSIFPAITKPLEWQGLGFDMKWNIGWMNDTLKYIEKDPIYRKHHHDQLTQTYKWSFEERYMLPISHDEVVHCKKHLFSKMPLDAWKKFAQVRLYYSAAICHPGKKLFFMGLELGEHEEWSPNKELAWHLLNYHEHRQLNSFIKEVNQLYLRESALWEEDFDQKGFAWIDHNDYNHSVISYLRKAKHRELICVHNYADARTENYFIRLPHVKHVREIMNSDDMKFGGSGCTNPHLEILPHQMGFQCKMAPLATMIFEVQFESAQP